MAADQGAVLTRQTYAHYAESAEMLERVLHDARSVPALASYLAEEWDPLLDAIAETLGAGWHVRGAAARRLRALLRVAVDFPTWKTLTGPGGMSSRTAATTFAAAVRCATAKP